MKKETKANKTKQNNKHQIDLMEEWIMLKQGSVTLKISQ